jgi:hypothetical protein
MVLITQLPRSSTLSKLKPTSNGKLLVTSYQTYQTHNKVYRSQFNKVQQEIPKKL